MTVKNPKSRLVHLDCLRGAAALLVLLEHLRAFLFVPFAKLGAPGVIAKAFYLVTGWGHQAVMIFFVLSGFLVGGSVIAALQKGTWSWKGYLLRRMSRLWVVLIPALLLTLFWDKLGYGLCPGGYQGLFRELYHSGPSPEIPADWSLPVFFGNAFFLQTILVPCFGTNGPLWSLANEFWYYLLFPLFLAVVTPSRPAPRILSFALAVGILLFLPKSILIGGLIWLLGALVFVLIRSQRVKAVVSHPLWFVAAFAATAGCLIASRRGGGEGFDAAIGVSVAMLVAALACKPSGNRLYGMVSAGMSEISYTLYLVHFPLLAFLFFGFFKGNQMPPGFGAALWFSGVLLLTIAYSGAVWWLFERNTDRLRKFAEATISTPRLPSS